VRTKFEVRSFPVPEITGGTENISAVPGYAHAPLPNFSYIYGYPEKFRKYLSTPVATFPEIFNGLFFLIDTMNVRTKCEVRSFTRS